MFFCDYSHYASSCNWRKIIKIAHRFVITIFSHIRSGVPN